MPWKAPYRPKTEISQSYNDGIATVYSVTDTATAGYKPTQTFTQKVKLNYAEQSLGIRRYYSAKQNQIDVERVIRVQKPPMSITNQDVIQTEDGEYYRIDLIQTARDVYPPSLDITLAKYSQGVASTSGSGGSST